MKWFVLTLTVGGFLIPVLRVKQFYLSPMMCALYALALASWIGGGRKKSLAVFLGSSVVLVGISLLLRKSYGEYAHVYQLFFYKLRFLGVKPENPAALPWDARCLWEGAFNTAGWSEFWRSLQWTGPLALAALALMAKDEGRRKGAGTIFMVFTVLLALLAWMVVRYFTFLGFAAAVLAAGLATRRMWWKAVLVLAAVSQLVVLNFSPLSRAPVVPADYKPVVHWLNDNTPTNAVVLASISESPVFLAYTGRPIILHSKFENPEIRERYREFLEAIYSDEDRFFAFATKYGADYFVCDGASFMMATTESRRYKANRLGPLDANCAAMLFVKAPQQLRHFEREFATERFTVFRVRR
jgi:energy-converting hydrogenase Eha subunit E